MITIHLTGQAEKIAPENPWGQAQLPLYHQLRTYRALQETATHLVLNSYNTGTGKTRAAFSYLTDLNGCQKDVLLVAPTNALLNQHATDAQKFVQEQKLDFKIIPVTAKLIQEHQQDLLAQGDYDDLRKGEILFRLMRNPREFFPNEYRRQGLLLVVNPDIFYYALLFQYGSNDQVNLFQQFLTAFTYIIIDEFHYYDEKQLTFFLFFFAISQKLGFFTHRERKICLLSATPTIHVREYLDGLFQKNWRWINPENEPSESANYPTITTLTPLNLTLSSDDLEGWGQANGRSLTQWVHQNHQDGAIISDSLRRINRLYTLLRPYFSEATMGRITGPEPESARQNATARPLILATPTVDIGYNFDKLNKKRQNIDFLICEARFGDDLIQRIGRAGRILGKSEITAPSTAVALIKDSALDILRPYHGQTLSRTELKNIIHQNPENFPQKHNLTGYIRSWAITEVFYPIHRTFGLVREDIQNQLEELYQQLHKLFERRDSSFKSLQGYFKKYYYREKWLKELSNKPIPYNHETAVHVCDWFKFRGEPEEYRPEDIQPYLSHENVLATSAQKAALRQFVDSQVHLTKSLFNFRESFQGPTAVLFDPDHLLSSLLINAYDLFHIVEGYNVQWLETRAEFLHFCGDTELTGQFYGRILSHRTPPLSLELHYTTQDYFEDFARQWECKPVALNGFKLYARERKGDRTPIDTRIVTALQEEFITLLLIPMDMKGWAIRALKNSPIYTRQLFVTFPDHQQKEYSAYPGKAAWIAHSELQIAFKIRDYMKPQVFIY